MAQYREKGTKKKYEASIITRNNLPDGTFFLKK
jgi:hypothetical protein